MVAIEMAGQLDRARPEMGPVRRLDRIHARSSSGQRALRLAHPRDR
jgi:hypothetical protein